MVKCRSVRYNIDREKAITYSAGGQKIKLRGGGCTVHYLKKAQYLTIRND